MPALMRENYIHFPEAVSKVGSPLQRLDAHTIIGVDFDGTLVGNPAGHILWKYIRDHHQTKQFYIVTFRFEQEAKACFDILDKIRERNSLVPTKEMFRGIRWRTADDEGNTRFKGRVCHTLGATVLIDDQAGSVEDGCRDHGIELVDATDLLELIGG